MHDTCVWLVQVIFYDQRVLRASQQNILHPHIMSLLGVPTLSTFCSTPPRCVNVDLGKNPDQCRLFSSAFFCPLLFFVTSFLEVLLLLFFLNRFENTLYFSIVLFFFRILCVCFFFFSFFCSVFFSCVFIF